MLGLMLWLRSLCVNIVSCRIIVVHLGRIHLFSQSSKHVFEVLNFVVHGIIIVIKTKTAVVCCLPTAFKPLILFLQFVDKCLIVAV